MLEIASLLGLDISIGWIVGLLVLWFVVLPLVSELLRTIIKETFKWLWGYLNGLLKPKQKYKVHYQ